MSESEHDEQAAPMVQWYRKYYDCPECGESWTDEWSCACNDRCPRCNIECEPESWDDLSRPVTIEDYLGVARLMTGSENASASEATDEDAVAYAQAVLEGGESRFLELLQEAEFIRRFNEERRV